MGRQELVTAFKKPQALWWKPPADAAPVQRPIKEQPSRKRPVIRKNRVQYNIQNYPL